MCFFSRKHCEGLFFLKRLQTSPANFSCQLAEDLFDLPTSHANFSRVTSPGNFSCQPLRVISPANYLCQLHLPTFRELCHLPTSHANFSIVTSPANFWCQLFGCYLIIRKAQANFSGVTSTFIVRLHFSTFNSSSLSGGGRLDGSLRNALLGGECVSKRSRCGSVRICLGLGQPSAEIVRVEALSLRRRANLS